MTGKGHGFLPLPSSSGSHGAGESDWLAFNAAGSLFMTNENPTQGVMQVNQASGDIVQPSFVPNLPGNGYAISFDKNGDLWVGDSSQVLEYSTTGVLLNTISHPVGEAFAAVFDPSGNNFYVGDDQTGFVDEYDLSGKLIGQFQTPTQHTSYSNPVTVAEGISVKGGFLASNSTPTVTVTAGHADFHDPSTVTATLHDPSGKPLANEPLSFSLNNAETCSGTTDPTGTASCSLTPAEAAGTYSLSVSFAGDSALHLSPATGMASFVVAPEQTAISYTGATSAAVGQPITMSASLTTDDPSANTPVGGKSTTLTLGTGATRAVLYGHDESLRVSQLRGQRRHAVARPGPSECHVRR